MGEKSPGIFGFITRVAVVFSTVVLFLMLLRLFVGIPPQNEGDYSAIFALGGQGITYTVLWQALFLSFFVMTVQTLFISDLLIKKLMMLWRVSLMMVIIFVGGGFFSALFGWFPVSNPVAWGMFLLCFVLGAIGGFLIMLAKTKMEDAQMARRLDEYKNTRSKAADGEEKSNGNSD